MEIINGIVIRSEEFNDHDNIVTIFSKEFGMFSFVALGTRKTASKNKYSIQLFSEAKFEIFKSNKNRLSKLKRGELILNNINLTKNYFNYILGSVVLDLTRQLFNENEEWPEYYRMLKWIILLLEKDYFPFKNFAFFFYQAMKFVHGQFELENCLQCSKKVFDKQFFDQNKYGIICQDCFLNFYYPHNLKIINSKDYLEMLVKIQNNNLNELLDYHPEIANIILLINNLLSYYEEILGIWSFSFKSLKALPILEN